MDANLRKCKQESNSVEYQEMQLHVFLMASLRLKIKRIVCVTERNAIFFNVERPFSNNGSLSNAGCTY